MSFWRSSLYFACSRFMSGCRRCMASIDRVPLSVSGVSTTMIDSVSSVIAPAYDGQML